MPTLMNSSAAPPLPYSLGLATLLLVTVLWLAYRWMLPRPLEGIPYKKSSARNVLGDAPDMLKWRSETKEIWSYIRNLTTELDSPIIQMFMRPFGKPWVIVADFREAQDIQVNRQHEFDRSTYIKEVFGPLLPGNHVWMQSNETFRAHRFLIKDTMSPGFLHDVVGPTIHDSTQRLLELWRHRARLAQGRPFDAEKDVIRNLVDVIIRATFGFHVGAIDTQLDVVKNLYSLSMGLNMDAPAPFPEVEDPRAYTSVRTLVDSLQIALRSPIPRQHLTFALNWYPYLVKARKWNEDMMGGRLKAAWRKFSGNPDADDQVKSAVDLLVQREAQMARRENRKVNYDTRVIRDELFGFFSAGHETTSTTICWALKYLTKHQEVQKKLRAALREACPRAVEEGREPTSHEILKADCPYLEAFIEENHRWGTSIPTVIRIATRDTVVLGKKIPKGTDVFMLNNGPSFQSPAFPIDESLRSPTSQEWKDKNGEWAESDIREFKPERWLVENEKGKVKFDPKAGPVLPYGFGLRGCFGMKLAVVELKVIISLLTWCFEYAETPVELSSFQGDDMNTHRCQQVYLRMKAIQ